MSQRVTQSQTEAARVLNAARIIARVFKRKFATAPKAAMTTFIMNSYDTTLHLSVKINRKLNIEACNWLKTEDQFIGKKGGFHKFSKDVRVMEGLMTPTDWDTTNRDDQLEKLLTKSGMIDLPVTRPSTPKETG